MKKGMILVFVAAIAAMFVLSQVAFGETCAEKFKRYDINGDGRVTMNEFQDSYDAGEYAGTASTPSGKPDAFVVFERLGGTKDTPITEEQFCTGEWH